LTRIEIGGLIADAAGNLFGTTVYGGAGGCGTAFELTNTGFQVSGTTDTTVPSETIGGPYSGNENTAIALAGLSVSASPNSLDPLSTVLSVANGTITVGTTGGATLSNNGTGSVTLSGTAAQIDADLAGASYQGNLNYYGPDSLSMVTTDTADGNQASATAAIAVADTTAPSETVGGPYSGNENTAIALGGLSVSASPNADDPLSTVLSVANGTITVGTSGGATLSNNGTGSVTLSGTAAQIDTALAGASYTGNTNYYGPDSLSMVTTDTADGSTTANLPVPTLTTLVTFNYSNGGVPFSGLLTDAAGDLFGTTHEGGANGDGTVFEIAKTGGIYATTPTTLVSFNGANGETRKPV
jgi:uncharacterized repeat protein (TIGR03803 family)